jgi:hypothetical protein
MYKHAPISISPRRPRTSERGKTRKEIKKAPPTEPLVMMPRQTAESATVLYQSTPEYADDSSCTTTKDVAPMSYPNSKPPRAGMINDKSTGHLFVSGSADSADCDTIKGDSDEDPSGFVVVAVV